MTDNAVLVALIKLRRALERSERTNDGPFRAPEQYCLYDLVNEAIDRENAGIQVCACGKPARRVEIFGQPYWRCGNCAQALYDRIAEGR